MRRQVLTLTLTQSRKVLSSFHIRRWEFFGHLTFIYSGMGADASKEVTLDKPLPLFYGLVIR